jgi:hypothetical protein
MSRPWMTVVKKNRQPVTDHRIKRYGCFEQLLLNVAGQFRPEPKGCIAQQSLELSEVIAHFLFPIRTTPFSMTCFLSIKWHIGLDQNTMLRF